MRLQQDSFADCRRVYKHVCPSSGTCTDFIEAFNSMSSQQSRRRFLCSYCASIVGYCFRLFICLVFRTGKGGDENFIVGPLYFDQPGLPYGGAQILPVGNEGACSFCLPQLLTVTSRQDN